MSKFTRKLQATKYTIAIVDNSVGSIVKGEPLRYKKMVYDNPGTWYADPFVLDVEDDNVYILAEEMVYSLGHARISKLIVDRKNMRLKKVIPLLTLSTHLSYPAIIRKNGKVYVYPESGATDKLTKYLYDETNEKLIEDSVIMEGPLADATITDFFGGEYLFCTKLPDCNGKTLFIYKKDEAGEFKPFQTYTFNENIARMAGDFFKIGDTIFRPAQDCNISYGNGTVIQKVELNNDKFEFVEVTRYFSPDSIYNTGIHTLNTYKGVTVVDLDGEPRYPVAREIIRCIKSVINK